MRENFFYLSRISAICTLFWASLCCGVANADLYDDYRNSASNKRFVSFLARSVSVNSPGHSFVSVGVELDNGLTVYERFLGLYPSGGKVEAFKSAISSVDGNISQKFDDINWSVEYKVYVNDLQHKAAISIMDKWLAETPKYNLLALNGSNCNVFASEVVDAIGLISPKYAGITLPQIYIERIKDENK